MAIDTDSFVSQIEAALTGVLKDILTANGQEGVVLQGTTCPMREFEGFDSLAAEEATAMLSVALGKEIIEPLFWEGDKPFTIDEIVQRVAQKLAAAAPTEKASE